MPEQVINTLREHRQHRLADYIDSQQSRIDLSLLQQDLEHINWDQLDQLIQQFVLHAPTPELPPELEPAPVIDLADSLNRFPNAVEVGREHLRRGKVAAFTVAGGQGSRLGFNGPKGAVPYVPATNRSLFELFAMMIQRAGHLYQVTINWFIMTSRENDEATRSFFKANSNFGLTSDQLHFIQQGMLPVVDHTGNLLVNGDNRLTLAPDGHGGSIQAMHSHGALTRMRECGVDTISYFQVDNPLVQPFDPAFIGLHVLTSSEMSTKVTAKAHDHERVGNVCHANGKTTVIEYSEFPEALCEKRNQHGNRLFDAGNLAIHLMDRSFVERLTESGLKLPFRRADKKVPFLNEQGVIENPDNANAIKFGTFVFDALPLAANPLVYRARREDEFAPVKNAEGQDSLLTSRQAMATRSRQWLADAGEHWEHALSRHGEPVFLLPSFALAADDISPIPSADEADIILKEATITATTSKTDGPMTSPTAARPFGGPDSAVPHSELPSSVSPSSELPGSESPNSALPSSELPSSELPAENSPAANTHTDDTHTDDTRSADKPETYRTIIELT